MEQEYELKLDNGKTVKWVGDDELDAATRYCDCHRGATIVATRPILHGLFIYNHNLRIED